NCQQTAADGRDPFYLMPVFCLLFQLFLYLIGQSPYPDGSVCFQDSAEKGRSRDGEIVFCSVPFLRYLFSCRSTYLYFPLPIHCHDRKRFFQTDNPLRCCRGVIFYRIFLHETSSISVKVQQNVLI